MKFVLDVVMWYLLAIFLSIGVADKCSSNRYMGNFFYKVASDYSKIIWAHGVNSKEHLKKALKDDSMMLEADISFGTVEGISSIQEPIMAHPPAVESDITLSSWLNMVTKFRAKGIKLDFKSTDVLEPSFLIIKERYSEINFPVWINADILPGPVQAPAIPVDPNVFLQLCKLHLPLSTISPSWTTFTNSSVANEDKKLNWKHVHDMVTVLRNENITQTITFPVRAAFIRASMELLEWLIDAIPDGSLTVWSGITDNVDVNDLLVLRKTLSFDKVYYDLPPSLNQQFQAQKDYLSNVEHDDTPYFDKSLFTVGMRNDSSIIVAARTMVLCGKGHAAFNYPLPNNSEGFEIFSAIVEFPDEPGNSGFDSLIFRFRNHNRSGEIVINMLGEIQFWDGALVMQVRTNSRKHQIKISVLSDQTHDVKEDNALVLVCLQPLFGDSKAKESNSPTVCQEIKIISTEQSEPLFTITSPDHGIKVLKDLRSSVPTLEASGQLSSACRLKDFCCCLMPVFFGILILGLNEYRKFCFNI